MTDTERPPIPHRTWCTDPDNVYIYDEAGYSVARCRSCRAELLGWPDDPHDDEPGAA